MKTEEQIREEIKKHKDWLKENWFIDKDKDKYLHQCIVEGLEWVLKEE